MTRLEQHREGVFRWYWKAIVQAYRKAPHAFTLGSGRETLAHWVHYSTGAMVCAQETRLALDEAVKRGWMRAERSPGQCTRFFMVHSVGGE